MFTSRLGWLGLVGVIGFAVGCAAPEDKVSEEPKVDEFAVLPVDRLSSILPAVEDSEGMPDVCVGLIGYSAEEAQTAFNEVTEQLTWAANEWNRILQGHPLWHLRGEVHPNYMMQRSECTQTIYTGFSVNLWKDANQFKADFCGKNAIGSDSCASAVYTHRRAMFLGPWNRTREENPLDYFTPLHEYGHLLGLGDTYRRPGVLDWNGEQPDSVMNGQSWTQLTDDDRLGLWATLRAVKTGVRGCEGTPYASTTENIRGTLLCNPKTEPVITHGPTAGDGQIYAPPTGPIPDSTLRETRDYTVAAIQLNCRAGAGTEHAVVTKLLQGTALRSTGRIAYSTEGRPWIQVSANGASCYASAALSFITPQGPIPMSTINEINDYAVSTERLNCRSGAGTEYGVVQELPLGTILTIDDKPRVQYSTDGNPWIHVRANGISCYSSANFKFVVPQIF